jgi:Peptidase S46
VVKGYEVDGHAIAPFTTVGGAFAHAGAHGNVEPYKLPPTWVHARQAGRFSLETPLNFVSTSDTIGGNSGSPIIARSGAVVGLNFDRNRYGLARDFGYDDRQGRNIAVDVRAITEALRSVYHADSVLRELRGR